MGAGCYRSVNRELFYVGGYCENKCFPKHGYCEAASDADVTKAHDTCELKPEYKGKDCVAIGQINKAVEDATKQGKDIFLYNPDMFSDFYYDACFEKLPNRNGQTYISVCAGVRTITDRIGENLQLITAKGIKEVWVGVESANSKLRDLYDKPKFTNDEVVKLTKLGRELGLNICWFLVDGCEDTDETRLETYNLIKEAEPFRIHIGQLKSY